MELMSYEEYKNADYTLPYSIVIKSETNNNSLYYFGERHSFNPQDEQWPKVKDFWNEFIKSTADKKRIVFTEGGVREPDDSEEKSILNYGGMGLVTHLASKEGIEVHSPEPARNYEYSELEKKFSRIEIQFYYFSRIVAQWGRKNPAQQPDFEEYMKPYLLRDSEKSGWNDFDFSLDNMKKLQNNIFNTEFSLDNLEFYSDITNPTKTKTVINKVSRETSQIRDRYIVQEILKYMENGYSIYAQFGHTHVVMQEPLLRSLIKQKLKL